MKKLLFSVFVTAALDAAPGNWLSMVSPIMSSAERKLYLGLQPEAQENFRQEFWATKSITADEYYRRVQYIDANFGSTKTGSGANTDPGRVYLSLGAPNRIMHLPSSRIFVPLEIWYYESAPAANLNTELRLIFYQKNALGLLKLYSPALDTIRALLLPEAGIVGMFNPNDDITESTIRQNLTVGPAEDEVLSAAVNVATGITHTGNDELLGQITSPQLVLSRLPRPDVKSRLILSRPKLETLLTPSPYGGIQADFRFETELRSDLHLQIEQGSVPVYESNIHFNSAQSKLIEYLHRLDLLPGTYTVLFSIDGRTYPYPLQVSEHPKPAGILRVTQAQLRENQHAPFEFDGSVFHPDAEGDLALLPMAGNGNVTWLMHRGLEVISKTRLPAQQASVWKLPLPGLQPDAYKLEAASDDGDYQLELLVRSAAAPGPNRALISYNANLTPALRYASVGHQWLLRGNLGEAKQSLQASLDAGITDSAEIELARADALAGNLDDARDRVRKVLRTEPKNFEALSVLAYIEAKFQDYPIAAELYRRALALQDSPALRLALASLPVN